MRRGGIISGCREKDRVVPEQAEQSGKHELNPQQAESYFNSTFNSTFYFNAVRCQ